MAYPPKRDPETLAEIERLWNQGKSVGYIRKKVGLAHATVVNCLDYLGIDFEIRKHRRSLGNKCPDVLKLRSLASTGTLKDIQAHFEVSYKIAKRWLDENQVAYPKKTGTVPRKSYKQKPRLPDEVMEKLNDQDPPTGN